MDTEHYTFCWTTERGPKYLAGKTFDQYWSSNVPQSVTVEMCADYTLDEALAAARSLGYFGKGTNRAGCYEVQCDRGIWTRARGRRNLNKARERDIVFQSWDDIETADLAA